MKNQKATHIQRIEAYNKLAITSKEKAEVLRKKLLANSIFRLIVFLIAAVFAYFMLTKSIWNVAAFSGTMAVFLLLLRRHEKLANEKKTRRNRPENRRRRVESLPARLFAFRRNGRTDKSGARFQFRFGYFWRKLHFSIAQPHLHFDGQGNACRYVGKSADR